MTAPAWPAPVVPQCPETCCFRETCSSDRQAGIASLWREGRITRPAQCFFFEHLAKLHRDTTGHDAPGSVAELLVQLAERSAIQGEGT